MIFLKIDTIIYKKYFSINIYKLIFKYYNIYLNDTLNIYFYFI
jgi:hypothetical protein